MGDQLGCGEHRVPAQPARHRARVAGFAEALHDAVPHIAADAGDDADRQLARGEHRPLLDMQLDPGGQPRAVNERLAARDALDIGTDRAHAGRERLTRIRTVHLEIGGGEAAEQRARAHIGFAETRALLAAQSEELDRTARLETLAREAAQDGEAGNDARTAVEITALRHGIEMRAAGDPRQVGLRAGQGDDQIGAGVALDRKAAGARFAFDEIECARFAWSVARAGDADAVASQLGETLEQGLGERLILGAGERAGRVGALHDPGLTQARSASSASSMTTPPIRSDTRGISRCRQKVRSPSMIWIIAAGCRKVAVPTCTAAAPASMYSAASSAVAMPPQPITAILTARAHWKTWRSTIGLIAGPESPPMMLPRQGLNVFTSIAIDRMVLATTTASAPSASAARATSGMLPVFGVSLTHSGSLVAVRSSRVTCSVAGTLMAKALPSSSMFGQEMFASIAATPGIESSRARLAKPSAVGAEMLTTSGTS